MGKTINGVDFSVLGHREPTRTTIARFGDKYYDVLTGQYVISYKLVRFIESTYNAHPSSTYQLCTGMKDAQAAYDQQPRKPINLATDLGAKFLDEGLNSRELRNYLIVCRRRWAVDHYAFPFPDTIRFNLIPVLPWLVHSDGIFIRSVRWPELVQTVTLDPGDYFVTWDEEKGLIANASVSPNATRSATRSGSN